MKYFTKEELEDITIELIENPTRETLQNLNDKYNGNVETVVLPNKMIFYDDTPNSEVSSIEETQESAIPPVEISVPTDGETVVNPIPNPNIEVPKVESSPVNNSVPTPELPSFVMPTVEAPAANVQNNAPINFTGNLFETNPSVPNLMQTTDNFNSVSNTMPSTDVPVANTPFFGPHVANENNPIPVAGPANSMPVSGPSMFGQFEQNYM